jgi:hypothetical protein
MEAGWEATHMKHLSFWASNRAAMKPPWRWCAATGRSWRSAIASQEAEHAPYGGVVPEIAARAHAERLAPMIER